MQQIVFQLLGPPEIRYKDQIIKIPRRRSRALLYYLVCIQTPQPRERLLALLCGDVDEESARRTFKTMLAEVRALLRGFDPAMEWIISDEDRLKLNPLTPLWLDTEIFEKVTVGTSRNLNRAISLYRGDFLDGFFLKDAPGFETWVRSTRQHFHHLYLTTLRRLAKLYETENQLDQAIAVTQMLLAADPLLEEAYARLMQLYWMTDRRVEALRQYEQLCEVLAQELAVKPSVSTRTLYEQIARSSKWSSASTPSASPAFLPGERATFESSGQSVAAPKVQPLATTTTLPPFIGRTTELAWLRNHLLNATNPYPLLLLSGESGIGKTRLLKEALKELRSSCLLLQGTCREVEQVHTYHALVEALRQGLTEKEVTQLNLPGVWRAQIAQLLPDLFTITAPIGESVPMEALIVAEALGALLKQLARPERPVLLILEDLHWADTATLALLGYLARSVQRGRVFLLGTFNAYAGQQRLATLRLNCARQNMLAELFLPPLSTDEIAQLVSSTRGMEAVPPKPASNNTALVDWCYRQSEGNPFFALAWLQHARAKEARSASQLAALTVPEVIVSLVKAQITALSREASTLLTAAAFLGMSFDIDAALRVVGLDTITGMNAGTELLEQSFIVEMLPDGSGYYTFVHSSVREVLLTTASSLQRKIFQQRILYK